MRAVIAIGLGAGCFSPHPQPGSPCDELRPCPGELVCTLGTCQPEDGTPPDSDPPPAACFGSLVRVCLAARPTEPLELGDLALDTDGSPMCAAPAWGPSSQGLAHPCFARTGERSIVVGPPTRRRCACSRRPIS